MIHGFPVVPAGITSIALFLEKDVKWVYHLHPGFTSPKSKELKKVPRKFR